jgi:hypothetical protein
LCAAALTLRVPSARCVSQDIPAWNKWYVSLVALAAWAVLFRALFFLTCKVKEWRSAARR